MQVSRYSGIFLIYNLKRVELGYWLSEEYWGKGIVTDAAKMMVKYFFSEEYTYQVNGGQPILRVDCNVYSWNRGSGKLDRFTKIWFTKRLNAAKVAEKLGFKQESYQQLAWLKKGQAVDGIVFRLLKEEYLNNPLYSS
mgnify:CR=1 FL=1